MLLGEFVLLHGSVFALLVAGTFPVGEPVMGIIAVMAVCPGAPFLLHRVRDRAVLVVILALVSVLAVATVPVWLAAIEATVGLEFAAPPATLARMAAANLILPLALGVAVATAVGGENSSVSKSPVLPLPLNTFRNLGTGETVRTMVSALRYSANDSLPT